MTTTNAVPRVLHPPVRMPPELPVYFDYNATAPIRPEVVELMAQAMSEPANASSVHRFGRAARAGLERSRRVIAETVGALPEEVVFTSGGTEANNLALASADGPIAVSAIEHHSVLNARQESIVLPVMPSGTLDLAMAEQLIETHRPVLIAVMLANNETGCLQPIAEIARLARRYGALLHVDAVQGLGKLTIDRDVLGADYLALSAHKIGGPQGVGALIIRSGVPVAPFLRGGAQEQRRRAGTENFAGVLGFARAVELASPGEMAQIATLRDRLERETLHACPQARVIGGEVPRLPNTTALALPGVRHETQLMRLDLDGIAVSTGSACSSGKVGASHVLEAMRVASDLAISTIRVSLGWKSSADDVTRFLTSWRSLADLADGRACFGAGAHDITL